MTKLLLFLCSLLAFQMSPFIFGRDLDLPQQRRYGDIPNEVISPKVDHNDILPQHLFSSLAVSTSLGYHVDPFEMFHEFMRLFNKTYQNEKEKLIKFATFMKNAEIIAEHNLNHLRGLVTYKLDFNFYSDWNNKDFVKVHNGMKPALARRKNYLQYSSGEWFKPHPDFTISPPSDLNKSVDWRLLGAVTPVKNQGECGSCWAFSATGSLEGQYYIKNGFNKLVSLSEQNLLDCSFKFGNEGCNGGLMDNAFEYIKVNKGLDTEASYPYKARENKRCLFSRSHVGASDYGFVDLPTGNEWALAEAVAAIGPISIGVDASHVSFQFYRSGIYQNIHCSNVTLDHGVLIVGYGSDLDGDYWLVKNSWGSSWGDKGYIKIARNKDNMCGVATQASLPIEKKNEVIFKKKLKHLSDSWAQAIPKPLSAR
ncbi:unnamed protein product [Gordionus sp. m RMFG-2023]